MNRTKWRETFLKNGMYAEPRISVFLFYNMKSPVRIEASHRKPGFLKCEAALKGNVIGTNCSLVG